MTSVNDGMSGVPCAVTQPVLILLGHWSQNLYLIHSSDCSHTHKNERKTCLRWFCLFIWRSVSYCFLFVVVQYFLSVSKWWWLNKDASSHSTDPACHSSRPGTVCPGYLARCIRPGSWPAATTDWPAWDPLLPSRCISPWAYSSSPYPAPSATR